MPTYSINGRVVDTNNVPIEGAIIMIVEGSSPFHDMAAVSDENGEFKIDDMENGSYVLQAIAEERKTKTSLKIDGQSIRLKITVE